MDVDADAPPDHKSDPATGAVSGASPTREASAAASDSIKASPTSTSIATSSVATTVPARRPLPGSAPTQSSTSPSAQPARRASTPKRAASTTDKMNDSKDDGKDDGRQSPYPPSATRSIADEIVVGTKTNGHVLSPTGLNSPDPDNEDVDMEDLRKDSPESTLQKRKRNSIYNDQDEDRMEQDPVRDDSSADTPAPSIRVPERPAKSMPQPTVTTQRSITLGYWRDSPVPNPEEKHAVVGFIDTRDRLRTRIQQSSRSGVFVAADFPLPPGPGGSWVTFERVVFDKHLVGLDHNQVKEYVKIRSENPGAHETLEDEQENIRVAVAEAMRRAALHPTPDNLPPPAIAYGVDLPDYVVNATRPEKKRRVASNGAFGAFSTAADGTPTNMNVQQHLAPAGGSPSVANAIQRSAIDLLPGTRPTKILLGYWRGSSEERTDDKHAVFGILGANDMFRVKVTRETRDGRSVTGNFPTGAGALWIHYDEVEFERHIRHLSRPEVKEYVRVRQRQIDEGEKPEERVENETTAVFEAQARVISAGGAAQSTLGTAGRVDTISFASAANMSSRQPVHDHDYQPELRPRKETFEPRQTRRSYAADARENPTAIGAAAVAAAQPRAGRHSLPDGAGMSSEMRQGSRPSTGQGINDRASMGPNADRVERTNNLARREVARVENIQMRNETRAASREMGPGGNGSAMPSRSNTVDMGAAPPPLPMNGAMSGIPGMSVNNGNNGSNGNRQTFTENIGRLNKVWASQESARLRAGGEDAKIFMGVKYERKQTGPFQGKLVSPGTILSIDGEDYVEYRVLTKPTFF